MHNLPLLTSALKLVQPRLLIAVAISDTVSPDVIVIVVENKPLIPITSVPPAEIVGLETVDVIAGISFFQSLLPIITHTLFVVL